jgi:hypothetical protein
MTVQEIRGKQPSGSHDLCAYAREIELTESAIPKDEAFYPVVQAVAAAHALEADTAASSFLARSALITDTGRLAVATGSNFPSRNSASSTFSVTTPMSLTFGGGQQEFAGALPYFALLDSFRFAENERLQRAQGRAILDPCSNAPRETARVLKELLPGLRPSHGRDKEAIGHGIRAKRSKSGGVSFDQRWAIAQKRQHRQHRASDVSRRAPPENHRAAPALERHIWKRLRFTSARKI